VNYLDDEEDDFLDDSISSQYVNWTDEEVPKWVQGTTSTFDLHKAASMMGVDAEEEMNVESNNESKFEASVLESNGLNIGMYDFK
jgi:xylose isomerase